MDNFEATITTVLGQKTYKKKVDTKSVGRYFVIILAEIS